MVETISKGDCLEDRDTRGVSNVCSLYPDTEGLRRDTQSNVLGPVDAWIARTHDIITHRGGTSVCSTLPIHACAGRCIGLFCVLHPSAVSHLRGTVRGAQLWTQWDSNPRHPPCKGGTLPLSYEPNSGKPESRGVSLGSSKVPDCTAGPNGIALTKVSVGPQMSMNGESARSGQISICRR